MTLQEIKEAVNAGKTVLWHNTGYKVKKNISFNGEESWIISIENGHAIGLTWTDGTTMNGKEEDFYIESTTHDNILSSGVVHSGGDRRL